MSAPFRIGWGLGVVDLPSILAAVGIVLLAVSFLAWRPIRMAMRRPRIHEARQSFRWQRERLEAKFIQLGQRDRQPGMPRWIACEFDDEVAFVRNRHTGELSAFVGVSVILDPHDPPADLPFSFESPDAELFDSAAARPGRLIREATAVFRLGRDHWDTDGRAIFNLTPSETIRFYHHDLEVLGENPAHRSGLV
ncbi:MAG: hypothetical protein JW818_09080 [Pirellulales bacterium]|nr:hypothetical protein [Pirellulales bacterium]